MLREIPITHSNWANLTHVCLLNIFARLPQEDRWKSVMFVCKSWLHSAKDHSLFSKFDLEAIFESETHKSDWEGPEFEQKIDAMLLSAAEWSDGRLKEVCVRHCSDQALVDVAERSPNLQVLSIKSCPSVTETSITMIAFRCRMLRELDISYCSAISYKSLELIGLKCPRLKVFKRNKMNWLDPCQHSGVVPSRYDLPQDGDREASAIAMNMPNLEHLELRFSKLSAKGLTSIMEGCKKIEYLDLFGCANLTSRAMELASTKLKDLKTLVRPNFYIPQSIFPAEQYGDWRLYYNRFRTNAFFQI